MKIQNGGGTRTREEKPEKYKYQFEVAYLILLGEVSILYIFKKGELVVGGWWWVSEVVY
jgi:hypothetical protein